MPQRISAKPLFDTFKKRGDKASFANRINISLQALANWEKRGVPAAMVRAVAHAMNLRSSDDYYRLADNGQKITNRGNNDNVSQTEADRLLALVKAFLDTDDEGQLEILEAAKALGEHGSPKGSERKRTKRR